MEKILVLYTELMPYNIPVLNVLVEKGFDLHIIKWVKGKLTSYVEPEIAGITYYNRSDYKTVDIFNLAEQLRPSVIYIAGWMDNGYTAAVKKIRNKLGVPVVSGCDTQWVGGRQWINVLLSGFRHKKWFSHILVAGMRQYEYAHRLGFDRSNIITPMYSADTGLFKRVDIEVKRLDYPRQILYIGRLAKEKGVLELIQAWKSITDHNGWKLRIIGDGPLKEDIETVTMGDKSISLRGFIGQEALVKELQESGAFILCSEFEPWALVIHEAAAAGLPILCTNRCGAADHFVINGYNGFVFEPGHLSIAKAINKIIKLNMNDLIDFSNRSRLLSERISPEIVANAILSVF